MSHNDFTAWSKIIRQKKNEFPVHERDPTGAAIQKFGLTNKTGDILAFLDIANSPSLEARRGNRVSRAIIFGYSEHEVGCLEGE
jgi:hypothetical protein